MYTLIFWDGGIMVPDLKFIEMNEDYLPRVLEIYNHYVQTSTATFHTQPLTLEEMRPIVFYEDPRFKAFVIFAAEQLCGYCILARFKAREAYRITAEATLYLHPDFTGKGIGSQVLTFLEDLARQNGFHSLIASICGENTPSIKLFEKNGYTKCAHFKEIGKKFGRLLDVVDYQKLLV